MLEWTSCSIFAEAASRAIRVEHDGLRFEHLGERPEGDALSVRQAAPDQHLRADVQLGDELAHEPALADSGVADERDELGAALPADAVERRSQEDELVVATDERRCEARHTARLHGFAVGLDEPRRERFRLSLQRERLVDRAELEVRACGTRSAFADRRSSPAPQPAEGALRR